MDEKLLVQLLIKWEYKLYTSNVWFIIVPENSDFVYKIFSWEEKMEFYNRERQIYKLFNDNNILTPEYIDLWDILWYFVLKLSNIRKNFPRKNKLLDFDLEQIWLILSKIHSLKFEDKNLILWDIHCSNFFELNNDWKIQVWIFDFSTIWQWDIEKDFSNVYIDLLLNDNDFLRFINYYNGIIDFKKLYKYSILELYQRIKEWMNLSIKKKKMYYKFILILKEKNNNFN